LETGTAGGFLDSRRFEHGEEEGSCLASEETETNGAHPHSRRCHEKEEDFGSGSCVVERRSGRGNAPGLPSLATYCDGDEACPR